uniref:C-type lectin domain family 4 member E-like n=1 Tax=Fundulus heteroclitus TaxID=8078 RepID=A0A3Q2P7A1_FUNHE
MGFSSKCSSGGAAASHHENPSRTSNQPQKVLLVLGSLLAAALIVLYRLSLVLLVTREAVRTLKEENEGLRKRLLDETCLKCEAGWELHGGTCYKFSTRKSSWNESRDSCKDLGGDLVKIDSREEQMFLGRRASSLMEEEDDRFWIGLTDSEEEGRWLWVDGSPLETSFWSVREPDNRSKDGAPEANCVRMGERGRADHLDSWFDISCYYLQKSICEKAAETERSSRVCG